MVLCLMNPYWFLWIRGMMDFWSLLASNLVIDFIELLSKEIGLKSDTVEGFRIFGTRVMKEDLILWRQTLPAWKAEQRL
jgi:hypothetical protein